MGFVTAGYDGTVDEVQFAKLLRRYSIVGAEDFKATTQAGDRIVAIADGTALGPGTVDVATTIPPIQFAAAASGTTRWDLVALRRNWQPPGGTSDIVIIQGGTNKALPDIGTATTAWNRRPGIMDDQPLYLQEIKGTLLGERIDLRVWGGSNGLYAKELLVRVYMDQVGTEININGAVWALQLGANDVAAWVLRTDNTIVKEGFINLGPTNQNGDGTYTFAAPFPNGVKSIQITDNNPVYSFLGAVHIKIHPESVTREKFDFKAYSGQNIIPNAGGLLVSITARGW